MLIEKCFDERWFFGTDARCRCVFGRVGTRHNVGSDHKKQTEEFEPAFFLVCFFTLSDISLPASFCSSVFTLGVSVR